MDEFLQTVIQLTTVCDTSWFYPLSNLSSDVFSIIEKDCKVC